MTRDELLDALMVERYTSPWWVTPPTIQAPDDDLTCARRRREMAADFEALDRPVREAR
jgi:hypothetical protein